METLLVQLNSDRESAQWLVLDEKGQPHAAIRQGPLESLKDFTRQRRVVCLLNGSNVYLSHISLPGGRNRKKLLQAIPFALEEELADDIERLHFAIGTETSPPASQDNEDAPGVKLTTFPVAVIEKQMLSEWLKILADVEVKPHVITSDVLSVPINEDAREWSVLLNGDCALLRMGINRGFACDPGNLNVLLDTSIEQMADSPPEQIRIWNHNESVPDISLKNDAISIDTTQTDQVKLATLARGYRKDSQINLLQGEFSFREEYGKMLTPWRLPGILLGVFLVALLTGKFIERYQLQSESDALKSQIEAVYDQVFPNSRNKQEPRRQMEAKLGSLGADNQIQSEFLNMLNLATKHISAKNSAKIQAISFNGERLDIELIAADVAQMDELKQAIDGDNLRTEIDSIKAEGDKVTGLLRISQP